MSRGTLSTQTGLSRDELLTRLCRELPDAVDKYKAIFRRKQSFRALNNVISS